MTMAAGIILCVDDDITVLNALRSLLQQLDGSPTVEIAESGQEALEICADLMAEQREISVVISDFRMPGMQGDELLVRLNAISPHMVKILLTGQSDLHGVIRAINEANLYRFLEKPFDNADLLLTVKSALHAYAQGRELERRNAELQAINSGLERLVAERTVEVSQKNVALTQAIRAREDAERIARHDLKTPLASIAATPALLRAGRAMDVEAETLLSMIENAAHRALGMVNLSLDLYRMENGSYVFHPDAVDLAAATRVVMQDLQAHAQAKRVEIRLSGAAAPVWVRGDPSLSYSILANLLKNAVEAAPDHTAVEVSILADQRVQLCIHNQGAVPEALRHRFFDKYATQGKVGGTGLGTYSSQVMARMQEGSLAMQTSEATGTTLTLELHRSDAPGPSTATLSRATPGALASDVHPGTGGAPAGPAPVHPQRVLLVDDDPYNRQVLRAQLPAQPLDVDVAINGRVALQLAMVQRPDIIFMDIEMPVMGGIEALQRIREFQSRQGQVPSLVVAFSSSDDAESQARYLALGFDRCLSKPSSAYQVAALLQAAIAPAMPAWPGSAVVEVEEVLLAEVPKFLESRRHVLDQLALALAAADRQAVRQLAHKLTGSLGMFGFAWASTRCQEIESLALSAELSEIASRADAVARHLLHVPVCALKNPEG